MPSPLRHTRLRHLLLSASVAGLAATICGCSRLGDGAIATAGEQRVGAAELRELLEGLPEPARATLRADHEALEQFVRGELVRRALLAEARAAGFADEPEVSARLEQVSDDALVRLWLARQAQGSKDYPTEEDLQVAWREHAAAFAAPTQYRVAQIFVSAPNGIDPQRLAAAMRKAADVGSRIPGGDFAALAREYSEHAESAARGGDVGLLPADRMLPEIVVAVRGLAVGEVAGPVKTSQGLHYVKLIERTEAKPVTFEQARTRLATALRERRAAELERAYLQQVGERLQVSIDEIALAQLDGAEPSPGR